MTPFNKSWIMWNVWWLQAVINDSFKEQFGSLGSLTWLFFLCIFLHVPWEEEGEKALWGSDRPHDLVALLFFWRLCWRCWNIEQNMRDDDRWVSLLSRCPFQVEDLKSRTAAAGLFRLTPWTVTLVKEEEICVFTCDKCTLNTALSLLCTGLPAGYVAHADQSSQYTFLHEVSFDIRSL